MFDRLLVSIIVALSLAPANATAQIVIEGSDGQQLEDDEAQEEDEDDQGEDERSPSASDDGPKESDRSQDEDEDEGEDDEAATKPSGLTIERFGGEDRRTFDRMPLNEETSNPPETLTVDAVRSSIESAIQREISACLRATPRPSKNGLTATFVATPPPDSIVETRKEFLVTRPTKLDYSPAMFLSEQEASLPDAEVAKRVQNRRDEFDTCVRRDIEVSLEASPPDRSWKVEFEFLWMPGRKAGFLGEVEWAS